MVSWSSDTRCSENLSPDSKFWYVDPLQKQGHIWFWHLIPCRSKVLVILYFSTPCWSKVITLLWYVDPLQKQGLGHSLLFDSLLKQSRNSSLICWSPVEARSHLIWHLIPCRSKGLAILYFSTPWWSKVVTLHWYVDPCRSKVTFDFGTWSLTEARSWPFFIFRLRAEEKS